MDSFCWFTLNPTHGAGVGVVRQDRQGNWENVKPVAGKAPASLSVVSPLAAGSPALRECWKENREWFHVS